MSSYKTPIGKLSCGDSVMRALLILCFLIPSLSLAQVVNIESDRGGDKQGLHGNTEAGVSLQRGNVQVFQYQIALRGDYISGIHHSLLIGSTSYGEEEGNPFQNESYAHLRWTAMWFGNVGTEVFTQVQQDEFKLLTLRQLTGGGLRFTFFQDHLALGVGGMSDVEKIEGVEGHKIDARGTSYVRLGNEWDKRIKGQIIGYYQPLFNDPEDYRLTATGSLDFKVTKSLSVVNEMNYTYDTQPPEGVINDDLQLRFKLKIKW